MTTHRLKLIHTRITRRLLRDCDTCTAPAGQPCHHDCPEATRWHYPRRTQ